MLNKIAVVALLWAVLIAPIVSSAAIGEVAQLGTTVKTGDKAQVIRLAANDLTQIQGNYKKTSGKPATNNESSVEFSKIPPQAWLVLTALFCFVMRSSRRTV